MVHILVTGGTGVLGRAVVPALQEAGHTVTVMSRHPRDDATGSEVEADLATGTGLELALSGVDLVVHLASAPYQGRYTTQVDIEGTRRLVAAANQAGVQHVLYVSIVGVDSVPWGYFRQKLAAERLVRASGLGWSIVRATQFHPFVDFALQAFSRAPVLVADPRIVAQPVDPQDLAARIAARATAGPSHAVEEFGGPELLHLDDAMRQWLDARGKRRPVLRLRLPGRLGRAFRAGYLTTTTRPAGTVTWQQYLATTAAAPAGYAATASAGKRKAVVWFERHCQNPLVRAALRAGLPLPMFALLETTGRSSGLPRQTPIINGLDATRFWIVAEHGRHAHYVRNIEAHPRVRVKARGRWRTGTAHILHDDDPHARARWMANSLGLLHKADAAVTTLIASAPLTIRVDLDQ